MSVRLRVFVATAPGHPISDAALDALRSDARVLIVGATSDRLDASSVAREQPDILISAAHRHLIPASVLDVPRLGAVGLHPSRLPHNRGSYPLWWSLRLNERETALSLFHLRSAVDAGPVIGQRVVPIHRDDTFQSLYSRVAAEVAPLLQGLCSVAVWDDRLPHGVVQDPTEVTVVRTPGITERALMRAVWATRRAVLGWGVPQRPATDSRRTY